MWKILLANALLIILILPGLNSVRSCVIAHASPVEHATNDVTASDTAFSSAFASYTDSTYRTTSESDSETDSESGTLTAGLSGFSTSQTEHESDDPQSNDTLAGGTAPLITVIGVDGPIGPTTASYIQRAIDESVEMGAEKLIIEIDTPGGLLESTKHIVQSLLASELPVVVYVVPSGASAASAGAFIVLASHVAAMAPGTNIGAATPVQMGGGETGDNSQREKIISYAESYIEAIAEQRNRNVEWAKSAVRDGASITETNALDLGVIEIIAQNRDDLIGQLDGWEVDDKNFQTSGHTVYEIGMTVAERTLRFLFRPEVMFILMIIAIYGIIGELSNPGAIVPGVTGVVALILLLYATAAMPVNTAGYILIALAIILFVAEAFTPAFGLLIATGAVSFVLGALMIFDDFTPGFGLSWAYIIPATVLTIVFFVFIVSAGLKAQFSKTATGREGMPGRHAEVIKPVRPGTGGYVMFDGELWQAISEDELDKGEMCEIIEIKGLTLTVKNLKTGETDAN